MCCTLIAMSPWPPQLIWQQEVVICTRFGMFALRNSSISSSIIDLTTPDASVPGMSQCNQPCVRNHRDRVLRATNDEAGLLDRVDQRLHLASSVTMYSMFDRMVKCT